MANDGKEEEGLLFVFQLSFGAISIRLIAKVSKNKKGPKSITLGVLKFKHDTPKKNHGPSCKANQKTHYIQRNYWFNSLGVPSSNKKMTPLFRKSTLRTKNCQGAPLGLRGLKINFFVS